MSDQQTDFRPLAWTEEQVETFWNFHAQQGQADVHSYFSDAVGEHVARYVLRHAPIQTGASFLDFGCGPGFFLDRLSRAAEGRLKLYGLDFSPVSVAETRERLCGTSDFQEAVCVQRLPSPWPGTSFDVVSALEVIEHLDDEKLEGFLVEAHRLLKPGGILFVTTPNDENLQANLVACPHCRQHFHRWQHVRSWSARSLVEHFSAYGFDPLRVEGTTFAPPLKRRLRQILRRNFGHNLAGIFRRHA